MAALENPGFEDGPIGGPPDGWEITSQVDEIVVVGDEGPAEVPVYGDAHITVSPIGGIQALRLKSPRNPSQNQPSGTDSIRQTFESTNATLTLHIRTFSFDSRRNDEVVIDVRDPGAPGVRYPVSGEIGDLAVREKNVSSCARTPCVLRPAGGRKSLFDSGWREITISQLPDDGRPLTISYAVTTDHDSAKPTWAYFDTSNSPPTAGFTFSPGSSPGTQALEGDYVVFACKDSAGGLSVDPDGDDLSCAWRATGPGLDGPLTAEGDTAVFVFPDDGTVQMTLTVNDGEFSDTVSSGGGGIPPVVISNGDPLVAALDVEVPAGGTAPVLCRYLDPGVFDTHTVEVEVNGTYLTLLTAAENVPALSSGYGRAKLSPGAAGLTAGENYTGSCRVTDGDGGNAVAAFTVSVLSSADVAALESSDTGVTAGAPMATAGSVYVGRIDSPADIDVVEIRLPSGARLPANGEVNVTVQVPADYDAVLFSRSPSTGASPFLNAPFLNAPFLNAPFLNVPFLNVPFLNAQFDSVPFLNAPFLNAPFLNAPFLNAGTATSPFLNAGLAFANFPLSQVGLAVPGGSNVSQSDVTLSDLGSQNLGGLATENIEVKAISANLGTTEERMLVRIAPGEEALYLAVVPQGGSFSQAPFTYTVEAYQPPAPRSVLGAQCDGQLLVVPPAPGRVLRNQANPTTLVVTQIERFANTHGVVAEDFLAALEPFFGHPKVQARVISVASGRYDPADLDTCSVANQNAVAAAIRTEILDQLAANPSIEFVQILGGLDIVPARFVPDETSVGNEALYVQDLFVLPGSPLAVGFAQGNNITDAYYVDRVPLAFRGRELYIEDVPVSRMLERPEEILAEANRFVAQNGVLDFDSALASGYDFFIDGTEVTASLLSSSVQTDVLNDDSWTANDLRCAFFGAGDPACQARDVCAVNAHMTYNAALSASGFAQLVKGEIIASGESANVRDGKLTLSIGCHSGLSVPDAWAIPEEAGLPFDTAADWVQQLGTWVGPYGYGLGDDTVADRGTEGLIPLVALELLEGESVGQALVTAKQRYASGLFEFDVHDEDSLINLGLFGMPQATLANTPSAAGNLGALLDPPSSAATVVPAGSLELTILEQGASTTTTVPLEQNFDADGTWLTANGKAQAIVGRPLLPAVKPIDFRAVGPGQTRVHGVALRGGDYFELADQDPVFGLAVHDWVQVTQPEPCVDTLAPTLLGVSTTFESLGTTRQSLIVQPAQFRCTLSPGDRGTLPAAGNFRVFERLELEALHPSDPSLDADFLPPTVVVQDLVRNPLDNTVTASLAATDASGMREFSALIFDDAAGTVVEVSTGDLGGAPGAVVQRVLTLPDAGENRIAIQYIDRAGNYTLKSLKGELLQAIAVEVLATILGSGADGGVQIRIERFAELREPMLTMDFGDGTIESYRLINADGSPTEIVALQPDGSALVTLSHSFPGGTGSVTVVATVRAAGAIGTDTATLSLSFCTDPKGEVWDPDGDIVACGYSVAGTRLQIDLFVDGRIDNDHLYSVYLPDQQVLYTWKAGHVIVQPSKAPVTVTRISSPNGTNDGLRFSFDAGRLGWNGVASISFLEKAIHKLWWFEIDVTDRFTIQP